ncbi:replication initiation protein [Streptomyces sp. G44]|uniref:replication initiation protein n=1 Tax=Streptomyces sp. G44 TaxID=2807632 RepID=UPI0019604FD4|nr:replication initiation protein [Streptomyces sp. G44]
MTRRYVEANPSALSNLLVVDVDHSDAVLRAASSVDSHPLPNAVVENPVNGHAHAVWALAEAEAVTRTEYARRKPLAYAAAVAAAVAVAEGLCRAVDGDAAYSGLSPMHTGWSTEWLHGGLRTLGALEEARWATVCRLRAGGRPSATARTSRVWAVTARSSRRPAPGRIARSAITSAVPTPCMPPSTRKSRNTQFAELLPAVEARAIANSIHRTHHAEFSSPARRLPGPVTGDIDCRAPASCWLRPGGRSEIVRGVP